MHGPASDSSSGQKDKRNPAEAGSVVARVRGSAHKRDFGGLAESRPRVASDPYKTTLNASAHRYSCGSMIASDLRTTGRPASTHDADDTRVRPVNRPGNPS